jgi:hypothetical protein
MELAGRVALVTGAGSGMGRAGATVQRLADEGMNVCALDINGDAVRAVAEPLGALAITCDVCPNTTDTGMLSDPTKEFLASRGVALVPPEDIASTVVAAATSPIEMTGGCWVVNPGEPPFLFDFNDVPGPHKVLYERRSSRARVQACRRPRERLGYTTSASRRDWTLRGY